MSAQATLPARGRDGRKAAEAERAVLLNLGLTSSQVFWMFLTLRLNVAVALLPVLTASRAGRDAWAASLLGTVLGLLVVWVLTEPAARFPGASLPGQAKQAYGRSLGTLLALLYLGLYLLLTAIILREYSEAIVTAILPTTPLVVVVAVTAALAAVVAAQDTATVGRVATIIGPVVLGSVLVVGALVAPNAAMEHLTPLWSTGWRGLASGALVVAVWHSQAFVFPAIAPAVLDVPRGRITLLWSTAMSGLLVAAIAALSVAVLSHRFAVQTAFPLFEVARQVEVGEFLQRIDALAAGSWGLGLILSASMAFHAGAMGLAELAGLSDHRPLVKPMGVILVVLAFAVARSDSELRQLTDGRVLVPLVGLFLWLPAAAFALAAFRKSREARAGGGG